MKPSVTNERARRADGQAAGVVELGRRARRRAARRQRKARSRQRRRRPRRCRPPRRRCRRRCHWHRTAPAAPTGRRCRPRGDRPPCRAVTATGSHSCAVASGSALPRAPAHARAGHGEEVAGRHGLPEERGGRGGQHAHAAVGGVGDEEVACRVHRHAGRLVELAGRRVRPVAVETAPCRCPATVTTVPEPPRTSWTRCAVASATKTSPCCVDRHGGRVARGRPGPVQLPPASVDGVSGPDAAGRRGHRCGPAPRARGSDRCRPRRGRRPRRVLCRPVRRARRARARCARTRRGARRPLGLPTRADHHSGGEEHEPGEGHGRSAHATSCRLPLPRASATGHSVGDAPTGPPSGTHRSATDREKRRPLCPHPKKP